MPSGLYKRTKEIREKCRKAKLSKPTRYWSGKKRSAEDKLKMSLSKIGKKRSKGTRERMSKAKTLENHPNWRGGVSISYPRDWTETLKESVRERDRHTCTECGAHQDELGKKLDVHHIDYDKDNCNPANLISLCKSCHMKTNFDREKWIIYFKL